MPEMPHNNDARHAVGEGKGHRGLRHSYSSEPFMPLIGGRTRIGRQSKQDEDSPPLLEVERSFKSLPNTLPRLPSQQRGSLGDPVFAMRRATMHMPGSPVRENMFQLSLPRQTEYPHNSARVRPSRQGSRQGVSRSGKLDKRHSYHSGDNPGGMRGSSRVGLESRRSELVANSLPLPRLPPLRNHRSSMPNDMTDDRNLVQIASRQSPGERSTPLDPAAHANPPLAPDTPAAEDAVAIPATARLGVSLRALKTLPTQLKKFFGRNRYWELVTEEVVKEFVKPKTLDGFIRMAELDAFIPQDEVGPPLYLASHVWKSPVWLLLDTILNFLVNSSEDTKVWVDFLAVNQHKTGDVNTRGQSCAHHHHNEDIKSFQDVVRLCQGGTIVAMDMSIVNPCTRTWCMYEWDCTIQERGLDALHLPMLSSCELARLVDSIDLARSQCSHTRDIHMIHALIEKTHGSAAMFNAFLKVQISLKPLSFRSEMENHRLHSEGTSWKMSAVDELLRQRAQHRALCLVSESGTGKSAIAAEVVRYVKTVHSHVLVACHFLKHDDTRRLDPANMLATLLAQITLADSNITRQILGLKSWDLISSSDPMRYLSLLKAALEARQGVVLLLFDGLDEADPPEEQLLVGEKFKGSPLALGNQIMQEIRLLAEKLGPQVRFMVTTRPSAIGSQVERVFQQTFPGKVSFVKTQDMRCMSNVNDPMADVGEELLLYRMIFEHCDLGITGQRSCKKPSMDDVVWAYEEVFSRHFKTLQETNRQNAVSLIEVLLAAREPVAVCRLRDMGFTRVDLLPAWGTLFFSMEDMVYLAHKSLNDWLLNRRGDSSSWSLDITRGHLHWTRYLSHTLGSPDEYALKYAFKHMAECTPSAERDSIVNGMVTNLQFLAEVVARGHGHGMLTSLWRMRGRHTKLSKETLRWISHGLSRLENVEEAYDESAAVDRLMKNAQLIVPPQSPLALYLKHKELKINGFSAKGSWWCSHLFGKTPSAHGSKMWSLSTATLQGHVGKVNCVAVSGDGRQAASGGRDNLIMLWDVRSHVCRAVLKGHLGPVTCLCWGRCGHLLASASEDHSIRLWHVVTGECHTVLKGHHDFVRSIALSADSKVVASGASDFTVKLWSVKGKDCIHTLEEHGGGVTSVAMSGDGQVVAYGSDDGRVRIWRTEPEEFQNCSTTTALEGHTERVCSVAMRSDGKMLVSGSDDTTVKVWSIDRHACLHTLEGHTAAVLSVALSTDSMTVVSGSEDKLVKLWSVFTGECLHTLEGHTEWVWSVALSAESRLVVSGSDDRTVKLWSIPRKSGAGAGDAKLLPEGGHSSGAVLSVAMERGGEELRGLSASDDHCIKLWNLDRGDCVATLQGHVGPVCSVATSQNWAVSGSEDCQVRLWSLDYGVCTSTLEGHDKPVRCVAVSAEGGVVVSGSDDLSLKCWNLETGDCVATLKGHTKTVCSTAISSDGTLIVSGSDDCLVKLWKVERKVECFRTLKGHSGGVRSVSVSGDCSLLASGSCDATIRIWNTDPGKCVQTLKGHSGAVLSVALSSDSTTLASGAEDCLVKLWSVSTGECLHNLQGHLTSVTSVVLNSNGRRLMSGGFDGTIRVWELCGVIEEKPLEKLIISRST